LSVLVHSRKQKKPPMPLLYKPTVLSTFACLTFLLLTLGCAASARAQQMQVSAASPAAAEQGTVNLNVKVTGKGFKNGARANFFLTGTTDPAGVQVNSTTFVGSAELTVNITVSDTAVIANFDVQVQNVDGRTGKGTELFAVVAKGGGGISSCPAPAPARTSDTKCYDAFPGCLDSTFGGSGFVTTDPDGPAYTDTGEAVVVQPDGRIIVAGTSRSPSGVFDFTLLRYNTDGSLDTTFGDPDPFTPSMRRGYVVTAFTTGHDWADAVLLQPDGKIVVGGGAAYADMAVARYNSDGSLDTSFGSGGKVLVNFGGFALLHDMAIQSDGKLVLAGGAGSTVQFGLARLNTDGTLDSSFGSGGKLLLSPSGVKRDTGHALSISIQRVPAVTGEERIVVGGWSKPSGATSGSSTSVWAMRRLKSTGATDINFGTNGIVQTAFLGFGGQLRRLAVDSSNRIVAAGTVRSASDNCGDYTIDYGLVRYTQDGGLDASFSGGTQIVDVYGGMDDLHGLVIQPDGKIVLAGGSSSSDQAVKDIALVRFNGNGTRDSSFGILGNGIVTTDFFGLGDSGYAVAVQPTDGKIVVTGSVYVSTWADIAVARYWQ
jgi:uncharacterized delta-60 repeat protein